MISTSPPNLKSKILNLKLPATRSAWIWKRVPGQPPLSVARVSVRGRPTQRFEVYQARSDGTFHYEQQQPLFVGTLAQCTHYAQAMSDQAMDNPITTSRQAAPKSSIKNLQS